MAPGTGFSITIARRIASSRPWTAGAKSSRSLTSTLIGIMCTSIAMSAAVVGSGKGSAGWFPISQANVGYDHATHSQLDHALLLDFVNPNMGVGARVAVEMDIASGKALIAKIQAAILEAESLGFTE